MVGSVYAMRVALAVVLALSPVGAASRVAGAQAVVDNSHVTYDVTGARLDAHDGMVVQDAAGTAWLFGTSYGCGFVLGQPSPWCGVKVYRSTDLQTWTPTGLAFDPITWQDRCSGDHFGCFRPHVAMRPDGVWVMWLNVGHSAAGYAVLTAPAPQGPWTEVAAPPHLAVSDGSQMPYGDETIYPDPASPATAYLVYTAIGHDPSTHALVVERLDPTWTTGTGQFVRLPKTPTEAPGLFRRGTVWYLLYSDPACAYCVTGTSYATAPGPLGPWTQRASIRAGSCGGQPAAVNVLKGASGSTTYVYQTDRWVQPASGQPGPVLTQTNANNYLAPLTFASNGLIPTQACIGTWTFN
jgi:beta-xylosidase